MSVHDIRLAVCAVGYLQLPQEKYLRDPNQAAFVIVGSGFLVDRDTVMTCGHVIDDLGDIAKRKRIPPEQIGLQFVYPVGEKWWGTEYRPFHVLGQDQAMDIVTLVFDRGHVPDVPVPRIVTAAWTPTIGEPIGFVGYPFGADLLRLGRKIWRFGPVYKQGVIAAMSPYDGREPEELVLDLVVGRAASGSPIFLRETGEVVGMLTKGQEGPRATISVARTLIREGDRIIVRRRTIRAIKPGSSAETRRTLEDA